MRLEARQMSRQLPELSQRLTQLETQCHYYFPRIKEQNVRLEMFKKSFESHKQHMLEAVEMHPRYGEVYDELEMQRNSKSSAPPAYTEPLGANEAPVTPKD